MLDCPPIKGLSRLRFNGRGGRTANISGGALGQRLALCLWRRESRTKTPHQSHTIIASVLFVLLMM